MARVATKAAVARKTIARPVHDHDADWADLLSAISQVFGRHIGPLFTTDVADLNDIYLSRVPDERKIHDCYACRKFLENYGGLVCIGEDGHTFPAFWDAASVPEFYQSAVAAMAKAVNRAKVTGVFLSSEKTWGYIGSKGWSHFAVQSPKVYQRATLSAGQAMAAKREDHHTVARALGEYGPKVIAEAERLFLAENLDRPERFLGPLGFMGELHRARTEAKDSRLRDNILWKAVATAPDGFCHIKASVIGPLLDDIASGLDFNTIKSRFAAMLHPLRYQRPQAAPKAQTIAQAEKLFEEMGLAPSLERRFARLDEIETVWRPTVGQKETVGGVFGHLKAKRPTEIETVDAPASVMTWEKFARVVLPGAEAIKCHITGHMDFIATTTAVNADAPNIMKWDNPFAWYVYHNGSSCLQWGLSPGWVKVNAISAQPTMWGDKPQPHLGDGFVLILDGCVDSRTGQGNALFPECLRGELHGVRATIEAYSRSAEMQGREEGSACGLDIRKGAKSLGYRLRVKSCGAWTDYKLDRWD